MLVDRQHSYGHELPPLNAHLAKDMGLSGSQRLREKSTYRPMIGVPPRF